MIAAVIALLAAAGIFFVLSMVIPTVIEAWSH